MSIISKENLPPLSDTYQIEEVEMNGTVISYQAVESNSWRYKMGLATQEYRTHQHNNNNMNVIHYVSIQLNKSYLNIRKIFGTNPVLM